MLSEEKLTKVDRAPNVVYNFRDLQSIWVHDKLTRRIALTIYAPCNWPGVQGGRDGGEENKHGENEEGQRRRKKWETEEERVKGRKREKNPNKPGQGTQIVYHFLLGLEATIEEFQFI